MKIVLQRVSQASVAVEGKTMGQIGSGFLLLCGISQNDDQSKLKPMAEKITNLRIFPDQEGRFHYSIKDTAGGILLVPQFTLFADTSSGRRPEFFGAMKPPRAEELFEAFCAQFQTQGISLVEKGVFGAKMDVSLLNEGPVTLILEN